MSCPNCKGTGRRILSTSAAGENVHSDYLDCAAPGCTAAADRVALGKFVESMGRGALQMDTDAVVWAIHQRARQQEREAIAAQAAPVVAASELSDEQANFAAWLAREMPAGTVIGDPAWWATRILRAVPAAATPAASVTDKPVAWIRFRSDGGYEGPIMDAAMEDVRKKSGAWTPLYAAPAAPTQGEG